MTEKENEYKYFETTADIGVEVNSENINKAFANAALATFDIITDINTIKTKIDKKIEITSEDTDALLYDWITELLILMDSESYIASKYDIEINKKDDDYHLIANISGDLYDTDIYSYKTEVKAITFHNMEIIEKEDKVTLKFILDL